MEYTDEQVARFKIEVARRRQRAFAVVGVSMILLLGSLLAFRRMSGGPWAILWIAWVVFAFIFSYQTWRCPACNRYLGSSTRMNFCPSCGARLR
jgi:fatty acid desaturase